MGINKTLKHSIVFCLFFFLVTGGVHAQAVLEKIVDLSAEELPLSAILDTLAIQCAIQFTYDKNQIPTQKKYSIHIENATLGEALQHLFHDSSIQYQANGSYLTLSRSTIPYYTVSGFIRDAKSGETLLEANVFDLKYYRGCSSNEYGFYSLSLPEGQHVIKTTYVGYQDGIDTLAIYKNEQRDILMQLGNELTAVIVDGQMNQEESIAEILKNHPTNGERVDIDKAQAIPSLMGERDVLKYLQLLPGVVSGGLGGNNLYIRGGSLDQNLILLDDVPLYNVNHLFGLVSVFNGDIIHSAKTYVDGFPARYGGRLSSIIDIRTKDGNKEDFHGGASLGLLTGTAYLEGPIQKGKSSFLLSARRTWLDVLLRRLNLNPVADFYDINAKTTFQISQKDRLHFSFYRGKDHFSDDLDPTFLKEIFSNDWSNTAFSIRWNRLLTNQLFVNTTLLRSSFNYNIFFSQELDVAKKNSTTFLYESFIQQSVLKTDFTFLPNAKHAIRFGTRYHFLQNKAGQLERQYVVGGVRDTYINGADLTTAHQGTLYLEDEFQWHTSFLLHSGIHVVNYTTDQKSRWYPQIRLRMTYGMNNKNYWSLSYSDMMQHAHLLDNTSLESNNNKWVLASENAPPTTASQVALNFQSLFQNAWKFKIGAYYKKMKDLRRFKEGKNIFNSVEDNVKGWEESTVSGIGKTYGLEVLVEKTKGSTGGRVSYTYAKSQRKFENFIQTDYFPYQYDRRHSLNLLLSHSFKKKNNINRQLHAVWTYASGNWLTLPQQIFTSTDGIPLPKIDAVNNYQLPAIHRLDISFMRSRKTQNDFEHTWNFGIYNVYGQNNPYTAELQYPNSSTDFELFGNNLSVSPIPYVTYGFKF